MARINRYRVLLDRADLERRLEELSTLTAAGTEAARADDAWLLGQFLTGVLVGTGRFARGERLSGRSLICGQALRHLLILLARHEPSLRRVLLDDLDPMRRFELAQPELGRELDAILASDPPAAARGLLDLARRELAPKLSSVPHRAVDLVAAQIPK